MGSSKTAAETESGKFSKSQAEEAGWKIWKVSDARAVKAGIGGGGSMEVLVEDEKWAAEATVDDHLITAVGTSEDDVLEQIRLQQASIDSKPRAPLALPVFNDNAGDADGETNVGIAAVLPETEVDQEAKAEAAGIQLVDVNP